jgi:hypothetical protein
MSNRLLFKKWSRWLKRIEEELREVVVHHSMFHALVDATNPYIGTDHDAWDIGTWIAQGSYAYLSLAIRRLTEPPKKNTPKSKEFISLTVLLEELATHQGVLTRIRQRKMYRTAMRHLPRRIGMGAADNAFNAVSGEPTGTSVSAARMRSDIGSMRKVSKQIIRRVNKIHAHIERDRRRIGKAIGLKEIDVALKVLLDVHQRYALLVQGRDVTNLMTAEPFDIKPQLHKIWPPR